MQTFAALHARSRTLEGANAAIARGPAASQIAIKQLGTNGGGFFNANSAHPFENPTPLDQLPRDALRSSLIPAALTYTFGRMVGRHAAGLGALRGDGSSSSSRRRDRLWSRGAAPTPARARPPGVARRGGNMEGKEVRFGIADSALWATATTDASNGAVNSMHDCFTPLGGLVPLLNIQLGEVDLRRRRARPLRHADLRVLAVFIAGLMIGRTPEYLGKKIEAPRDEAGDARRPDHAASSSCLSARRRGGSYRRAWPASLNAGPHGFCEILYAFTSAADNNGSAFAGLTGDTTSTTSTLGLAMLIGRFLHDDPDPRDGRRRCGARSIVPPRRHASHRRAALRRPARRRRS